MNEITLFCYFILSSTLSPGYESFKLYINNDNIIGNHTLSRIRRQTANSCKGLVDFRCMTTSECIDRDRRCDGRYDCSDDSDEKFCNSVSMCITPPQPDNGQWTYFSDSKKVAVANMAVPALTQLVFRCNNKYILSTTNKQDHIVYCREDKEWSLTVFLRCQKTCPPQYNRQHAILECKLDGSIVPCDKATDGTVLTYTCDKYYEPDFNRPNVCTDGSWSHSDDPRCKPVCGEKQVSERPLIVNGNNVARGQYPWVVAVYSDKDSSPDYTNICSGSLLSTSVVLTVAHCVTNQETGKVISTHYFRVAGGKYYNLFRDPRDNDIAQYSEVQEIFKPEGYRGYSRNFKFDIALLKLRNPFTLSKVVQPVCFTYSSLLTERRPAIMTGWGYTSPNGNPSDVLKEIDISYVDIPECSKELDPDWAALYWTSDKFCAGTLNKNMNIHKGDSGGGLAVKGDRGRYYIQGILSLNQRCYDNNQTSCKIPKVALFTRVQDFSEWIDSKL